MHIPDGYLGPQTYLSAYGVMAPLWAFASAKVKKTLRYRQAPMMALGAAFTFVVMMFNIPVPGGTTGHAVGAVLVALLLGPWAACVAVSVALAVQAFLFGDGGITALAANCFTMAVVMPFVGWWSYRLLAGASPAASRRRSWAAAAAGYIGLNAAAFVTAVLFGIQPALAHDATGRPLYCPFSLGVAVPAMMVEHLLFFGFAEAAATGLVFSYLMRTEPTLIADQRQANEIGTGRSLMRRLVLAFAILVLLVPLGLYLPAKFGAGEAWGEWGTDRLKDLAGLVPAGLEKLEVLWRAPLPDYAPKGEEGSSLPVLSGWYLLSAAAGVTTIGGLFLGLRRWISRKESDGTSS